MASSFEDFPFLFFLVLFLPTPPFPFIVGFAMDFIFGVHLRPLHLCLPLISTLESKEKLFFSQFGAGMCVCVESYLSNEVIF